MAFKQESRRTFKRPESGRILVVTGAVGSVLAAICCATPVLGIVLGALGLTAWLATADYVLIPIFLACLGLLGIGLYRRRSHHE